MQSSDIEFVHTKLLWYINDFGKLIGKSSTSNRASTTLLLDSVTSILEPAASSKKSSTCQLTVYGKKKEADSDSSVEMACHVEREKVMVEHCKKIFGRSYDR